MKSVHTNPGFREGDRIELMSMRQDPDPIEPGTCGTVTFLTPLFFNTVPGQWQIGVKWDNGRTLMLLMPPDLARRIST